MPDFGPGDYSQLPQVSYVDPRTKKRYQTFEEYERARYSPVAEGYGTGDVMKMWEAIESQRGRYDAGGVPQTVTTPGGNQIPFADLRIPANPNEINLQEGQSLLGGRVYSPGREGWLSESQRLQSTVQAPKVFSGGMDVSDPTEVMRQISEMQQKREKATRPMEMPEGFRFARGPELYGAAIRAATPFEGKPQYSGALSALYQTLAQQDQMQSAMAQKEVATRILNDEGFAAEAAKDSGMDVNDLRRQISSGQGAGYFLSYDPAEQQRLMEWYNKMFGTGPLGRPEYNPTAAWFMESLK